MNFRSNSTFLLARRGVFQASKARGKKMTVKMSLLSSTLVLFLIFGFIIHPQHLHHPQHLRSPRATRKFIRIPIFARIENDDHSSRPTATYFGTTLCFFSPTWWVNHSSTWITEFFFTEIFPNRILLDKTSSRLSTNSDDSRIENNTYNDIRLEIWIRSNPHAFNNSLELSDILNVHIAQRAISVWCNGNNFFGRRRKLSF